MQIKFPFAEPERSPRPELRNERPLAREVGCGGAMIMLNEKDSEIAAPAAIGPLGTPSPSKYDRLIAKAKQVPAARQTFR